MNTDVSPVELACGAASSPYLLVLGVFALMAVVILGVTWWITKGEPEDDS